MVKSQKKPGKKGPQQEIVNAIIEMKKRNPSFGYLRIAMQIYQAFGIKLGAGIAACSMFNRIISQKQLPKYLSSDHDPLFQFYRWQANLRVLEIEEIKSVPYTPISHPYVERLIGTIRREYLDRIFFWNERDLENKLNIFQDYYNESRAHSSLEGELPAAREKKVENILSLHKFRWKSHCNKFFNLPIAA